MIGLLPLLGEAGLIARPSLLKARLDRLAPCQNGSEGLLHSGLVDHRRDRCPQVGDPVGGFHLWRDQGAGQVAVHFQRRQEVGIPV